VRGGHYLAQKHTRKHMREAMKRGVCHQLSPDGKYQEPRQYAIDQTKWILASHHRSRWRRAPAELDSILASADKQLN